MNKKNIYLFLIKRFVNEVWFTDENPKLLEKEDETNITLVIN